MISILKQPYTCSLTQNNMLFEVKTDKRYQTQRVAPSMTITWTAIGTAGQYFSFKFINPETDETEFIKVTCTKARVNEGDVQESTLFTGSLADYSQHVFDVVREIVVLNAFYTISKSGNTITISAKAALAELVMTNLVKSGGLSMATIVNKADSVEPKEREGFELVASVYVEQAYNVSDFAFVGNMNVALDETATGKVNVSRLVHGAIEASWFNLPMPDVANTHYLADNTRRYYVEFMERWSNETNTEKRTSHILYAHWGGQSFDDANLTEPLARITAEKKFLTHQPSGKIVHQKQRDWISWINTGEAQNVEVILKVYWDEGGLEVNESTLLDITVDRWQTLVIQTGAGFLNPELLTGGFPVLYYTIEVVKFGTATQLSEVYTYYVDKICSEFKTLFFFNGYGLPETVFTTGPWIETFQGNKQLATRSRQFNLSNLRPSTFVFNKESQNVIKAQTQVFPKKVALRLQDLLNATVAYLYDDGFVRPIIVLASAAEVEELHFYTLRLPLEISMASKNKELSFYDDMPSLVLSSNGESDYYFTINRNNYQIVTYGNLFIVSGGVAIGSLTWNAGTKQYNTLSANLDARYYVYCDVTDAQGKVHQLVYDFFHKRNEISFETIKNGAFSFLIQRASGTSTMHIDYGDGVGTFIQALTTSTTVNYTFLNDNLKQVSFFKQTFADITGFTATNIQVRKFELNKFISLTKLHLVNCDPGAKIYLTNIPLMTNLLVSSATVNEVEIDFMPNLATLTLNNLALTTAALEALIERLWSFRKLMNTTPNIQIVGGIPTVSARTTAMINGTGEFATQGLVTHYLWTVNIA